MLRQTLASIALCAAFSCGSNQADNTELTRLTASSTAVARLPSAQVEQLRDCARAVEAVPSASPDLRILLLAEACLPDCPGLSRVNASRHATWLAEKCGYDPSSETPVALFVAQGASAWVQSMRERAKTDHADLVAQLDRAMPQVRIPIPISIGSLPRTLQSRPPTSEPKTWIEVSETETRIVGRSYVQITAKGRAVIDGERAGVVVPLDDLAAEYARLAPVAEDTTSDGDDGTGTKMSLDEGKMGAKDSARRSGQYSLKRNEEIEQARRAGVLGIIVRQPTVSAAAPMVVPEARVTAGRLREVLGAFASDGIRLAATRGDTFGVHRAGLIGTSLETGPLLIVERDRLRIAQQGEKTIDVPNLGKRHDWDTAKTDIQGAMIHTVVLADDLTVQALYDAMDALASGFVADVLWLDADVDISWVDQAPSLRTATTGIGGIGSVVGGVGTHLKAPIVRLGSTNVTGDLDKDIIRRYIRRKLPQIRHCYEIELLTNPSLAGKVVAKFQISSSGAVFSSSASGLDPKVDACVANVIGGIVFPKPTGGGMVNVSYPFTFKTQ
jgi:hypothetical protein